MATTKEALYDALCAYLKAKIATMRRLALDAAEAVGHKENRPESNKDMRLTEASYIARGQAARVLELERELGLLRSIDLRERPGSKVGVGSLVEVRS
ncbi:MAG: hypothetical protein RMJ98_08770 [Myxococcales bacterium]|nr:hypothetical protein [Polyangiaceae bacterium]MDW8249381.1 hypothetical protein [Myxococcales bacterium]